METKDPFVHDSPTNEFITRHAKVRVLLELPQRNGLTWSSGSLTPDSIIETSIRIPRFDLPPYAAFAFFVLLILLWANPSSDGTRETVNWDWGFEGQRKATMGMLIF